MDIVTLLIVEFLRGMLFSRDLEEERAGKGGTQALTINKNE